MNNILNQNKFFKIYLFIFIFFIIFNFKIGLGENQPVYCDNWLCGTTDSGRSWGGIIEAVCINIEFECSCDEDKIPYCVWPIPLQYDICQERRSYRQCLGSQICRCVYPIIRGPENICGDGICSPQESYDTCPQDCIQPETCSGEKYLSMSVLSPSTKSLTPGGSVTYKIHFDVSENGPYNSIVTANCPDGSRCTFNQNDNCNVSSGPSPFLVVHNDDCNYRADLTYTINTSTSTPPGSYTINFSASGNGCNSEASAQLNIAGSVLANCNNQWQDIPGNLVVKDQTDPVVVYVPPTTNSSYPNSLGVSAIRSPYDGGGVFHQNCYFGINSSPCGWFGQWQFIPGDITGQPSGSNIYNFSLNNILSSIDGVLNLWKISVMSSNGNFSTVNYSNSGWNSWFGDNVLPNKTTNIVINNYNFDFRRNTSPPYNAQYKCYPTNQYLSVSLSANPSSGQAPLTTNLIATVSSTAIGTINYTFWKNCNNNLTSVAQTISQCGQPDAKYDNQTQTTQSVQFIYENPGNYVPKVIVEQGIASPVQATTNIVVNPSPPPPSWGNHLECNEQNQCVSVLGPGPDRCSTPRDCGYEGSNFAGKCESQNVSGVLIKYCVNKECDPSIPGDCQSECQRDEHCNNITFNSSHLTCYNNACVIVGGPGQNNCLRIGQGCRPRIQEIIPLNPIPLDKFLKQVALVLSFSKF